MSDNTVTSEDVHPYKKSDTAKKTAPKKTAPKKKPVETAESAPAGNEDTLVIMFESGSSYSSGDFRFTRQNQIQEVPRELGEQLLRLDNFRLPNPFELEDFNSSRSR